jgi:ABC-2 type transport system ATP-binding protein
MDSIQNLIEVENLTKRFGRFTAVDHVSFEVHPGEVIGYLGPNGSGKTTTIRMLCGLMTPTEGTARIMGIDVVKNPEAIKPHIGYMSQKFSLYDDLTVLENIEFYAGIYEIPLETEKKRIQEILRIAGLENRTATLTADLSGGWRQRLALGCAMLHKPPVLFLDEPTSGVDPVARREFWDLIYEFAANGTTVLITTHYMDEAEHCNRVGFMYRSKLLSFDTPRNLKSTYLQGTAWDLEVSSLLDTVEWLNGKSGIAQATLHGDRAHIILDPDIWTTVHLKKELESKGIVIQSMIKVESTLEDVFTLLAHRGKTMTTAAAGFPD